jgi:hypothetical protein
LVMSRTFLYLRGHRLVIGGALHDLKLSVVATSDESGAVLTAFAGGVELAKYWEPAAQACIFKERGRLALAAPVPASS